MEPPPVWADICVALQDGGSVSFAFLESEGDLAEKPEAVDVVFPPTY